MGVAVRVIPCLDVDAGRVVKGVNFRELRDAGDPVEMAARLRRRGRGRARRSSTSRRRRASRATMLDVVRRTAEQVFIPLTVGGGIRSADDVDTLLRAGADKVSINTAAIARPELLRESAAGSGRSASCCRSTRARCRRAAADAVGLGGHHARRAPRHRDRRGRVGGARPGARRGGDPAQLDGRRRHPRGLRPADDRRRARGRRRAGDRVSGGAGAVEDFAPAVRGGRRRGARGHACSTSGHLRIGDVKASAARAAEVEVER